MCSFMHELSQAQFLDILIGEEFLFNLIYDTDYVLG